MCSLTALNEIFSALCVCVCVWHIFSWWVSWWHLKSDEHLCVMHNSCYPSVCAISIGYWFSGECIRNMIRPIVVGGYSRFFPCINLLLMAVTAPWPPASSGNVQSVSLRWEGCPRSATVMILMTIRWRLVYVCTQYICKVIFTHRYLLISFYLKDKLTICTGVWYKLVDCCWVLKIKVSWLRLRLCTWRVPEYFPQKI